MSRFEEMSVVQIRELLCTTRGGALDRLLKALAEDPRPGVRAASASAQRRRSAERREAARVRGLYRLETDLAATRRVAFVAGLDEVGRGAFAGPLTVAAVVLPSKPRIEGIDDSKRLTSERREIVASRVLEVCLCHSVAHVPADEIDSLGMTRALRKAFTLAIEGLDPAAEHIIIDGHPLRLTDNETAVIKGDSKVACVAAASVVAKVARDALMVELASTYPGYGFDINKGYGTAEHQEAIRRLGPSPVHRRSFIAGGGTGTLF